MIFPADLAKSVNFHLLFHCHYFAYPVLVFVFKFNCNLGNRYFWRCILKHTERRVHKWKFYNMRCLVMFVTAHCSVPASERRSVTFFQLLLCQERMVLFISFRIDFKCLLSRIRFFLSVFRAGVIGRIPVVPRNKSCPHFTFLPF